MDKTKPIYKCILEKRRNFQPLWEKKCLTIDEAAVYFGIGSTKIRTLIKQKSCPFVIYMNNKPFIIREKLEKYLDQKSKI